MRARILIDLRARSEQLRYGLGNKDRYTTALERRTHLGGPPNMRRRVWCCDPHSPQVRPRHPDALGQTWRGRYPDSKPTPHDPERPEIHDVDASIWRQPATTSGPCTPPAKVCRSRIVYGATCRSLHLALVVQRTRRTARYVQMAVGRTCNGAVGCLCCWHVAGRTHCFSPRLSRVAMTRSVLATCALGPPEAGACSRVRLRARPAEEVASNTLRSLLGLAPCSLLSRWRSCAYEC